MSLKIGALRRLLAGVILPVMLLHGTVAAITSQDLQSIINNTPNYGEDSGNGSSACNSDGSSSGTADTLPGGDAKQKVFNYFVGKGLTDVQAAAIEGNFIVESSLVPTADNGSHRGIAQWDYADRYAKLKTYASSAGRNPDELGTQLDYAWMELQGTPPAHDYSGVLTHLKTFTNADQIADATTYFQDNYEGAPGQGTQERITAARSVLRQLGGTSSGAVSGSDSSCSSVGSVNCDTAAQASAAGQTGATSGGLSQLRQNVVCLTNGELALWESGKMKAGHDFFKYSQNSDELWCADFASWIYWKAGYQIGSGSNWRVPSVDGIKQIGMENKKFHWHAAGSYTPRPGDLVIHQIGESHVNIVVSVNTNTSSMVLVGGDQHGSGGADGNVVNKYTVSAFSGTDGINGYVSPD